LGNATQAFAMFIGGFATDPQPWGYVARSFATNASTFMANLSRYVTNASRFAANV
jgi:hypothetical protein